MSLTTSRLAPERRGRIAVGFDGSEESSLAVRWAAIEAARRDLTLRIVSAFGPDYIFTTDEECRDYMDKVAGQAVRVAEESAAGITVEHRGHRDLPAPVLLEESTSADLLVVGCRGRGGFAGLLLGSVSRHCIHRSACPVVVIRPPAQGGSGATDAPPAGDIPQPERPESEGRRIVVGVDGSPSSNAGLLWAAEEAESTGSTLELLHCWEWLTGAGWAVVPSDFDPRHGAETLLNKAVETVRATHPEVETSAVTIDGQAADRLVVASKGADLLVVGCRGHGELSGMLLGSVSDYCATRAHCPVLIMRGPHHAVG